MTWNKVGRRLNRRDYYIVVGTLGHWKMFGVFVSNELLSYLM